MTKQIFIKTGYNVLQDKDWPYASRMLSTLSSCTFHKSHKKVEILVFALPCWETFRVPDLSFYKNWGFFHQEFLKWDELPKQVTNKPKGERYSIRAVWYMPILSKVPVSRVTKRFTQYRKAAAILYFYAPELNSEQKNSGENNSEVISSSEILIVDGIRSKSDYMELLSRAIQIVENE